MNKRDQFLRSTPGIPPLLYGAVEFSDSHLIPSVVHGLVSLSHLTNNGANVRLATTYLIINLSSSCYFGIGERPVTIAVHIGSAVNAVKYADDHFSFPPCRSLHVLVPVGIPSRVSHNSRNSIPIQTNRQRASDRAFRLGARRRNVDTFLT